MEDLPPYAMPLFLLGAVAVFFWVKKRSQSDGTVDWETLRAQDSLMSVADPDLTVRAMSARVATRGFT